MKLKIREILWEITNRCNRNCDFCGSKSIINCGDDTSAEDKIKIAEEIAVVKPEKVTISGGEPLMLDRDLLEECVRILQEVGTQVSVVTNGDALDNTLCGIFDLVGISVNNIEDADTISGLMARKLSHSMHNKIVWITNVNKINFFDLDYMISAAATSNVPIQFQLTMYHNLQPEMIDGESINDVREKISKLCNEKDVSYIFADNLQVHHECTAGTASLGILYNGEVVTCLSERSWRIPRVQGNILETPLELIWTEGFKGCRFSDDFPCCRDCFNYPTETTNTLLNKAKVISKDLPVFPRKVDDNDHLNRVMLWGYISA